MTTITPLRKNNTLIGFKLVGHANYNTKGKDIVCAGVSTLSINAINSLEQIAHKEVTVYQSDGYLEYKLESKATEQSNVLLESVLLGYRGIAEQYPSNVVILEK